MTGYNDVSWKNSEILTPNMETYADLGVKLDQFYVQPSCSPSRAALLTGYYPIHNGFNVSRSWSDVHYYALRMTFFSLAGEGHCSLRPSGLTAMEWRPMESVTPVPHETTTALARGHGSIPVKKLLYSWRGIISRSSFCVQEFFLPTIVDFIIWCKNLYYYYYYYY